MKKVSVIITCHDNSSCISETIESVLNQRYKNTEIIVILENSAEINSDIFSKYENNNIILDSHEKNKNIIFKKNSATKKALGEYILEVSAGDILEPTFVEKTVQVLEKNEKIKLVYSKIKIIDEKNKELKLEKFTVENIIFNNCIPDTTIFRKEDFISVGGYKENLGNGWENWDLWLSILELSENKNKCVYKINEFLCRKRKSNTRLYSTNKNSENALYVELINNHQSLFATTKNFYKNIESSLNSNIIKDNKLLKYLVSIVLIQLLIITLLINLFRGNIL